MINQIVEQYKNKKIDKNEYSEKMFKSYECLFQFNNLIKNSIVKAIEITEEKVIISIKQDDREIKMVLNPVDTASVPATIMSFGEYENEELYMSLKLLQMLDNESVVFDIGANLGWYTINILKDMNKRKVYSFEPIGDTFVKLKENLEINNLSSESIFNIGFYDENKSMEFFYDTTATCASSLADLRESDTTRKIECKFEKMDDFINNNSVKRLDFIKCDVEGAELFVYKGAIESIKEFRPVVFSEMLRKWCAKFEYHPNDIINLFREIDYKCFIIKDRKLEEIKIVDEDTIETNYFFLHIDNHKHIIEELVIKR